MDALIGLVIFIVVALAGWGIAALKYKSPHTQNPTRK